MRLLDLPTELLLGIASYLDNANDKIALAGTCRRVYEATKSGLYRFLAVDQCSNAAIWAAFSGDTGVLDALWPYDPRLVNRYWEYDAHPDNDFELGHRNNRAWDLSDHPCPVCQLHVCQHPPYPDNSSLVQRRVHDLMGLVELSRTTACFEYPRWVRFTLLHFAALFDDTVQISWLLDHGASINTPGAVLACREFEQDGEYPILTPLQLALCNRNGESAKLLIERGVSLRESSPPRGRGPNRRHQLERCTPAICVAAAFGVADIVTLLLEKGVPVDEPDAWGYTALHHAADRCWQEDYFDIFRVLLEAGADLNDRGNVRRRTPLEIAYRQGNFAAVRHLLSLGATLDQLQVGHGSDGTGLGLLHFTCAFEARGRALRSSMHSCFSNSRLDEDGSKDSFTRDTWEASRRALVAKLLDLGHDPNSRMSLDHPWCRDDIDGYIPPRGQLDQSWWETTARSNILPRTSVTALTAVSFDCDAELVDLLIRRGAEVDARDSNGMTLLWLLCDSENLMDDLYAGWYDTFTYRGPTYQWEEKIDLLLRAGAKIDPWAETESGSPSERALQMSVLVELHHFSSMMEKATAQNMPEDCLGYLAGGLFAKGAYEKALVILRNYANVRLDAGKHGMETWSVVHLTKDTAEYIVVPLLQYQLDQGVTEHLQKSLRRAREKA